MGQQEMRRFKLGQVVTHVRLGVTLTIVGIMEPTFGGQVLVDWDNDGKLRWWCDADELTELEAEAA